MIRYQGLGYIALNVTDLERAHDWYVRVMGAQCAGTGADGGLYLRTGGRAHHGLVLYPAARPGLKRIGWQMESDDAFDALRAQLERHSIAWRQLDAGACAEAHVDRLLRMTEPVTGATLDFYVRMDEHARDFEPTVARLRYLCHVGIATPRYREAIRFYEQVLNFRTSDEIEGRINLMRCFPNPLHHSFALASGTRNMLHHLNIMVEGEADMAAARTRFRAEGVPIVWDGNHPPSGNTFLFFLDPDGLSLEYGHGMELFPESGARAARVFPARPESFDSTGAHRDERTATVGEIEPAAL
jgi:2,3-dihydroxy-p-cumate/2,3-dihydroxybenzoate 3,4-dioxygenase